MTHHTILTPREYKAMEATGHDMRYYSMPELRSGIEEMAGNVRWRWENYIDPKDDLIKTRWERV